jgi:hypothetical protein
VKRAIADVKVPVELGVPAFRQALQQRLISYLNSPGVLKQGRPSVTGALAVIAGALSFVGPGSREC